MKKILLFILTLGVLYSFTVNRKKEFIPPGTVKINDSLFADKTEISNSSWLEFEASTKIKFGVGSKEHLAVLPDTTVWRDKDSYNEPYVIYYYRHPAYKEFPVVGVSHEQAIAYCKWRTERVIEKMSASKKFSPVDFDYRLPSKSEWEFLSNNGEEIFKYKGGRNEKGEILMNCAFAADDSLSAREWRGRGMDVTAPVSSYKANHFGLYNMIGNVAEMVSEQGVCKGGGWRQGLEECRVGKNLVYNKPMSWLGFRCVCVVTKAKSS